MNKLISASTIILILFSACNKETSINKPPVAPSVSVTDVYHGQEIIDPYRNLENLEDSTVIDWLREQSKYAFGILDKIPGRQKLIDKQSSYDVDEEKFSFGFVRYSSNGKYFYTKWEEGYKTPKIYYRENLESNEQLLFDPKDHFDMEVYSMDYLKPDWVGNQIVIGFSKKGEEVSEVIVVDVATSKRVSGIVKNCLLSFAGVHWLSDNSGFIYLYSPNNDTKSDQYWMDMQSIVYKIGSNPEKRVDVFSKQNNPELNLQSEDFPIIYNYDSEDGYVFAIAGGADSYYDKYYMKEKDLLSKHSKWIPLYKASDRVKQIRVDKQDNLVFLTTKNASKGRICKTPMSNPDFDNPDVLVKEKKELIIKFHNTKDGLYFTTQKNGIEEKLYRLEGTKDIKVELPRDVAEMNIQSQSIDQDFLKISTWGSLSSGIHYLYDLETRTFSIEPIVPVKEYKDFKDLKIENIEIPSHDGVMLPITIIYKESMVKNGANPTLFYGYGSYGGTGAFSFNPNFLTWVTEGGILVVSYVRGGGHKGDEWHKAGFKKTKPNTWKDMIATTEYMIKEGYTNPEKTAIWGSSAGGILAGRAMTDRPDLYQAVMLTSPAVNMIRSEVSPNGKNSVKEFGTVTIKEEFEALLEMDSYHHIEKGVKYPATLVTGGMKDGRVAIWDPAKFVARLQEYNAADAPVLFDIDFEAGHAGMDANQTETYEFYANVFAFALWQMGIEDYQPK